MMFRSAKTKEWSPGHAVLARAEIQGENITIRNVRNFSYRSKSDFTPGYYDKSFKLSDIVSVDFVVSPLGRIARQLGTAHTFVTFGFRDGSYLVISAEARRLKGEKYSMLKGLFRHYELSYIIADERDAIRLRTDFYGGNVYLFPIKTTPERIREMLLSMLRRANALQDRPEYYNLFSNSCTMSLIRHVNSIVPGRIPWGLRALLSLFTGKLAYELRLIDTSLPYPEAKARHRINGRAQSAGDSPDFSRLIRA